ncbi:hypothetical protein OEZ85_011458 [Tetradesmus obliquus]|uniref:Leucine-rich repeat-containing N-terminal plant-type domain-containing protein n=1 Tax=Tetradesmus obliquus TaxID=3088 RepID=A0ABY8TQE3_TETOB|nr:hypothetical protein OEZ85_011458 [Tetradesmus obliquus]
MLYPLLRLQSLQQLVLLVYDGALPPQLGSLSRLNNVTISQYCLNGLLPPLLLRGLPELRALLVLPAVLKSTYVSPTGEQCGITGPVPMEWQTTKSNITRLELPYHRPSGKLPNIGNWLELRLLDLQSNRFEGEVPLQWDAFFRAVIAIGNRNFDIQIDISNNVLQAGDLLLPPTLPVAAPSLEVLDLKFTGIQGTLPREYGDWPSLQIMDLGANALTGTIPPWSNLSSIRYLQLAQNKLQGTLPAEMGLGNLPKNPELYFSYNKGITGTIPASWAHFSAGMLYLAGTGIDGCIPDGMSNYTWSEAWPDPYPYCSLKNSSDALVLSMLKAVLVAAGASPDSLSTWDTTPQATGPAASPRYCRLFKGVACDANSRVAQLDLTALGHDGQVNSLSLLNITKVISPLTNLKVLVLANLGISGSLADVMQPGFDAFPNLVTLDISGNPGVTGPLPDELAVLTNLQVLDVSGCSISGTLPISFVALQQLREFRAVNCTKLSGTLPEDWGMLANLEVLAVTNAGISGPLPLEYADYLAMQKAAAGNATGRGASGLGMLKLRQLLLNGNNLSGSLPVQYAQMRDLQVVNLSQNQLVGTIPRVFASLTKLTVLGLGHNQLQGPLPAAFVSLRQLAALDVSNNMLNGSMPTSWRLMAGQGFRLQCLLLANNTSVMVNDGVRRELMTKNAARIPGTGLAIDDPSSSLCMLLR